jgi:hypothetical protein
MNFALWSISIVLEGSFNMAKNLKTWVRQLYFPSQKKACCGFLSLSAGLNMWTLGPVAQAQLVRRSAQLVEQFEKINKNNIQQFIV